MIQYSEEQTIRLQAGHCRVIPFTELLMCAFSLTTVLVYSSLILWLWEKMGSIVDSARSKIRYVEETIKLGTYCFRLELLPEGDIALYFAKKERQSFLPTPTRVYRKMDAKKALRDLPFPSVKAVMVAMGYGKKEED